jgi:hypothetical protein
VRRKRRPSLSRRKNREACTQGGLYPNEGNMDTTTLLIIILIVLLLGGGGWYGRGRWY